MKYCGANTAFPVTNDFVLHMSGARFCIATDDTVLSKGQF